MSKSANKTITESLHCPHCGRSYGNKGLLTQCVKRCSDKRDTMKQETGKELPFMIPNKYLPKEVEFCSHGGLHSFRCVGRLDKDGLTLEECELIR